MLKAAIVLAVLLVAAGASADYICDVPGPWQCKPFGQEGAVKCQDTCGNTVFVYELDDGSHYCFVDFPGGSYSGPCQPNGKPRGETPDPVTPSVWGAVKRLYQ